MRNAFSKFLLLNLLALVAAGGALAQRGGEAKFELGGGVAGSFYDKKTLTSPVGNADAGFDTGLGASIWLGHYMYPKFSGEIRYDFLKNDMKLEGSGGKATFASDSHAVHYDVHLHFNDRSAAIRPYAIVGGGFKMYRGTGEERAVQPLSQIAVLTKTNELAGMVTFGLGVKVRLGERAMLRVDFRDNLTRFPKKLITPNRGTGASGWVNNFIPTVGASLLF